MATNENIARTCDLAGNRIDALPVGLPVTSSTAASLRRSWPARPRFAALLAALLSLALMPAGIAHADPAPFDLTGPSLRVSVTHGGVTLPLMQVPNLSTGDRLKIAAELPKDQGTHYALVAAFLRGATNPPPRKWFFEAETWKKKKNTLDIVVPEGAGQLIVFLVPETGGGFDAIVEAVRKQPGAFVRASQDLNQASLDRARLDAFLDSISRQGRADPTLLQALSPVLTHSLAIKLKAECLNETADLQASCLTQSSDTLVLADTHSASLTETLVGAPTDLALQIAATPAGGYGYYSPYIGVARDIARIFGAFNATEFRYVPSLARVRDDQVGLLLNAAPSFAKPKTVIITSMPAIEAPELPPLRRAGGDQPVCAGRSELVLPVEGAPLIYSTGYAHDMVLRWTKPGGGTVDLPVKADPERGGYILAGGSERPGATTGGEVSLHGMWGFVPFDGPRFMLQPARPGSWRAIDDGGASLVVGRENKVVVGGAATSCVDRVEMRVAGGAPQSVEWKATGADRFEAALPLDQAKPGEVMIEVHQHGLDTPDRIKLSALSEVGRMNGFTLHAGDAGGTLTGTRLDMVESLTIDQAAYRPGELGRANGTDSLAMATADGKAPAFAAGQKGVAKVRLVDGRVLSSPFTVAAARPSTRLISKSIDRSAATGGLAIGFAGDDAVPLESRLTFSIRGEGDTRFSGRETIEVALVDGRASTMIDARNGLAIQSDRVAVASFDPAKSLGNSAYGPLRYRVIENGITGDWTSLASLVRLPKLAGLACAADQPRCTLTGSNLFLLDAVADNADFTNAVAVPEGFTGHELTIPKPAGQTLYLRLRDDTRLIATATLPQG